MLLCYATKASDRSPLFAERVIISGETKFVICMVSLWGLGFLVVCAG